MQYRKQIKLSFCNPAVFLLAVLVVLLGAACNTPQKVSQGTPFVFKTNIIIEEKIPNDKKADLIAKLTNQLDDSLHPKIITPLSLYNDFQKSSTPVFDSVNITRSKAFMSALLNASGFYSPVIRDTFTIDSSKRMVTSFTRRHWPQLPFYREQQFRVTVTFRVKTGKELKLDSVGFALTTPELQTLTQQKKNESLLLKGKPYSRESLSAELDRLVELFRNNGYYRFSKEDLYIEQDTVIAGLIDPLLDPFEQAKLLEELKVRKDNPTINVVVKQRVPRDSTHLKKFYIGEVTVYPDQPIVEDTVEIVKKDTTKINDITFITQTDKFKLPFINNNVYLRPGRLYRQSNYYRTLNRFNQLSAWQQSNIDIFNSDKADSLVDVVMHMYPAQKQSLNATLEASRNTNDIITASNLFGVGVILGLRNRNAFKQSVQTTTDLRTGVELGANFIQTTQASISHTLYFPRLIDYPFALRENRVKTAQTIVNANAAYTDRRDFFKLRSINGSFGWQIVKVNPAKKNTHTFIYRPLNVEYTLLDKTDSLQKLLDTVPSLRLAFKTGLVISQEFVYSSVRLKGNKTNFLRASIEESGALTGLITSLDKGPLFRFVKMDLEYRHTIDYPKTQLAMRLYGGVGFAYGRDGNTYEQTLPFYKAYWAGGPNSMRAWQVRQLGLGSSKLYDDPRYKDYDRFGDVQLEGNMEYRFPLGTLFTIKIKGAVFTDVGNIWNRHVDTTASPDIVALEKGSDFKFNRFYKEFAVGAGTGLRLDFSYFLIRFDWAYRIKDPQRVENDNKWFYGLTLGSGQFQLGIGYPF